MAQTLKFGKGTWATKTGSSMAYNDQNGNYKPLPFNVERDSIATRVNKEGLIEVVGKDKLRIDYTDSAKGVALLEPSRTNLVTHSDAIQSVGFNGVGTSIQADVTISPDGTTNADLHKENTANGSHFMFKDFNLSSGQTYSISVFAKSNGVNRNLRFGDGGVGWSSGFNVDFDLTNGTASSGGVIKSYGNGWYRCSVVGTTSATTSRLIVYNILNTSTSYQGDGSSGVFLYGLQIEAGSYPTSIINTKGSAVTRVADVCNNGGNDQVINSEEGCFYFEGNLFKGDDTNNIISITDGGVNNYIYLNFQTNTNQEKVRYTVSGSTQINYNFPSSETMYTNSKYAISYKTNEIKIYRNGVEIITDTSATMLSPNTLNKIQFSFNNNDYFKGYIKDLKLYNTALTDQELAALTQV